VLNSLAIKQNYKLIVYLLLFVILIVISLNESLLKFSEKYLESHMIIEHSIFFLIGILSVIIIEKSLKPILALEKKKINTNESKTNKNKNTNIQFTKKWINFIRHIYSIKPKVIWLVILLYLLIFWHIPFVFDIVSNDSFIHILQHISFILSGSILFILMRQYGELFDILLIFSITGMMGLGGIMFAVLDKPVFQSYTLDSHRNTGNYMLILSLVFGMILLPFYLIKKTFNHIKIYLNSSEEKGNSTES